MSWCKQLLLTIQNIAIVTNMVHKEGKQLLNIQGKQMVILTESCQNINTKHTSSINTIKKLQESQSFNCD